MARFSAVNRSYNSFSGVDIKATFAGVVIAELQAISYSITREKAPIYTMGSPDPRSFSRGKRGIAGSLIFIMFDQPALLNTLKDAWFQSDKDDIHPEYADAQAQQQSLDAVLRGASLGATVGGTGLAGIGSARQEQEITTVTSDQEAAHPWYTDQIPGFDVTLAAANEYGALAVMKIFGVEILNEGYGVSIDDIVSEQQMTYIARGIMPWHWVQQPDQRFLGQSAS